MGRLRHETWEPAMLSQKLAAKEANVVMNGLAFGESPRWHDGRLWFCNWGTGQIIAVDADGNSEVTCSPCRPPCPIRSTGCRTVAWSPSADVRGWCCGKKQTVRWPPTPICGVFQRALGMRSSSTGAATSTSMAVGRRRLPASISAPAPSC
ncbi:hypothetical protein BQ8482_330080 [Mesorhizobium delmotii]|uniref:SMP-30/Gluconolactonase/LRE-like region domain-containing protein n=1 Tax=Mesorhizobium delmotii TaxID=1631247 RepID=A0A2P9AP60_9HYPH|nr:hypothetical protein BQ8482_330080 [Mesorhizobium delmotii]